MAPVVIRVEDAAGNLVSSDNDRVITVTRGEDLICESIETRIFCVRDEKDRRRIHAIAVPEDIRRLCE